MSNGEAFVYKQRLVDPITEQEVEPDEKLMRSIEEQGGVTENAKRAFREDIMIRILSMARKGQKFDYTSHDRLKESIEKKLFADLQNVVQITSSTRTPGPEQQKRMNNVVQKLVADRGYCDCCADELRRYVGTLFRWPACSAGTEELSCIVCQVLGLLDPKALHHV